ncbi:MAG: RluA family pseudouridine synthase [Acidobacteriota bacterium]
MNSSFQFLITQETAGQRVDEFLASRFGALSRMRIARLISSGACLVNRATAQSGWRIIEGDLIEITVEDLGPTAMHPSPIPLEILYEDEHLIVVVKPSGLLVHPTVGVKTGTLANALTYHFNKSIFDSSIDVAHGDEHSLIRPGMVHRLDRATSGLMVVAKTARALQTLSRHFQRRLVEKRYLAIVVGEMIEDQGTIIAPIGRDVESRPRWRVMETGREAETRFIVRERKPRLTLIELEPVTGRTNQLRIHCAHIGHPILGDELYGSGQWSVASGQQPSGAEEMSDRVDQISEHIDGDDQIRDVSTSPSSSITSSPLHHFTSSSSRLCLHAYRLAFHHPLTGEWMKFASPLPDEIERVMCGVGV